MLRTKIRSASNLTFSHRLAAACALSLVFALGACAQPSAEDETGATSGAQSSGRSIAAATRDELRALAGVNRIVEPTNPDGSPVMRENGRVVETVGGGEINAYRAAVVFGDKVWQLDDMIAGVKSVTALDANQLRVVVTKQRFDADMHVVDAPDQTILVSWDGDLSAPGDALTVEVPGDRPAATKSAATDPSVTFLAKVHAMETAAGSYQAVLLSAYVENVGSHLFLVVYTTDYDPKVFDLGIGGVGEVTAFRHATDKELRIQGAYDSDAAARFDVTVRTTRTADGEMGDRIELRGSL